MSYIELHKINGKMKYRKKIILKFSCVVWLLYGCEGRLPEPIEIYHIGEVFDL
jgi:hypothetical protein